MNTPKNPGNAPSYAATAWIRSEPIIQTAPEVISVKMNPSAITSKSTSEAPPYTVKTCWIASMKPPIPEIALVGSTSRIPRTGIAYRSTPMIPLRNTVTGTSRCGSTISSAAPFWSSNPT